MHGGFLTLAGKLSAHVEAEGVPDVILVSSMMNVAAYAGAVRHVAPGVPIAVYFHESQFTYPLSAADRADFTYKMMNWGSAAVADLVIFNSAYHRDVFREEAHRFLNNFPEHKHVDRIDEVVSRSVVLPVGIDLRILTDAARPNSGHRTIVWNQRWEHDKGPGELKSIVAALIDADVEFSMAMCGEVFVSVPPEFAEITGLLGHRLVHTGWAERGDYLEILLRSSVVLSTADQEFFGIGVVEGIAAGAHPVLPNRLVYPERVAQLGADPDTVLYSSVDEAVDLIVAALDTEPDSALSRATLRYDWSNVAPKYDATMESLVGTPVLR